MPVFLEVRSGPQTGQKIRLNPGERVRIGRTQKADIVFASDPHMSSAHFSLECIDDGCRLTDLNSSNGSWLNGQRVTAASLRHGDSVVAGQTEFRVNLEATGAAVQNHASTAVFPAAAIAAAPAPAPAAPARDRLLALLRNDFQPLFAILDSACDIRILALLLHHKEECQSLYEGEQGAKLAQVAPYLVRLWKDSPLLEALVKEGWGKSWGVYLTSAAEFQQVRHHLRHFLEVKLPSGEQVYFRFYDPRVLRVFLPTCTPEDTTQFFGPIRNYLVEDENPEQLLRFFDSGRGGHQVLIALDGRQQPEAPSPETESAGLLPAAKGGAL